MDWNISRVNQDQPIAHPTITEFGATPDFFILDESGHTHALLEIKNCDVYRWNNSFGKVVPDLYKDQVHAQMCVTGIRQAYLGILVGGNQAVIEQVVYQEGVNEAIEEVVQDFIQAVKTRTEPPATQNGELYKYTKPDITKPILTFDMYAPLTSVCQEYALLNQEIKDLENQRNALKDEIIKIIGTSPEAQAGDFRIQHRPMKSSTGQTRGKRLTINRLDRSSSTLT